MSAYGLILYIYMPRRVNSRILFFFRHRQTQIRAV